VEKRRRRRPRPSFVGTPRRPLVRFKAPFMSGRTTAVFDACNYTLSFDRQAPAGGCWIGDPPIHEARATTAGRARAQVGSGQRAPVRPNSCWSPYTRARSGDGSTLVLNATDQPLAVVPARRAVVSCSGQRLKCSQPTGDLPVRTPVDGGAVGRQAAGTSSGFRTGPTRPSRAGRCSPGRVGRQYCGRPAENVDHVVPCRRAVRTHGTTS